MSLLRSLLGGFGSSGNVYPADFLPSVVLLLKTPLFPESEDILKTAQRAWGANGPVELVGTLRKSQSYALRCGALAFSIHCNAQPYGSVGREPTEFLQRPWDDHKAWMSIDLPNARNEQLRREGALGEMYKVLLIYAFLSWSANCLAVFFPSEGITIPNFGPLAECIQWARRNGLDLRFLD